MSHPVRLAPSLTGDRVTLRAVRPEDVDDIVDISVYDGVEATDAVEARAMLRRIEAELHPSDEALLTLTLRSDRARRAARQAG